MTGREPDVGGSYDRLAEEYVTRIYGELAGKPFDRRMLDWLAEKVDGAGPLCDMGCGPGQVAAYLHGRGLPALGIDLSAEMVRHARRLAPAIPFHQGDFTTLEGIADGSFGGIAAFYSIIHVPRAALVPTLGTWRRVLRPRGVLLLAFHLGEQPTTRLEELWGQPVALDFHYFEREEMKGALQAAGFALEEAIERDPYPGIEAPTRRAYLFARNP